MAILSVNTPYVDGGTVTSTNLNALVTGAAFVAGATDNVTTELSSGAIIVKDGGVSINKLNTSLSGAIELNGTAYVGGDKTGNARGNLALEIQSRRGNVSQVASGANSTAIGNSNIVSGGSSHVFGNSNSVTNGECTAVGYGNALAGYRSVAFGTANNTQVVSGGTGGQYSKIALGAWNSIKQNNCTAVGYGVEIDSNSSQGTVEFGTWGDKRVNRISSTTGAGCSLRMHSNGQVAFTIANTPNPPTDGGATDGDEVLGTLPREMFTIQQNLGVVSLYYNDGGTISSIELGTLS